MAHSPESDAWKQLVHTDYRMARIGEDIINVLIAKKLIALADLPQPVQDLLTLRNHLRQQ